MDDTDFRVIVEVLRDAEQEVRRISRVGVEDADHVAVGVRQGPVEGGRLAFRRAAGEALDVREGSGEALADGRRRIDRSVLDEEDLEKVFRILQSIRAAQGAFDNDLLVPRGDHDAHGRQVDGVPQRSFVERLRAAPRHAEAEEDQKRVVAGDHVEREGEADEQGRPELAQHPFRIERAT